MLGRPVFFCLLAEAIKKGAKTKMESKQASKWIVMALVLGVMGVAAPSVTWADEPVGPLQQDPSVIPAAPGYGEDAMALDHEQVAQMQALLNTITAQQLAAQFQQGSQHQQPFQGVNPGPRGPWDSPIAVTTGTTYGFGDPPPNVVFPPFPRIPSRWVSELVPSNTMEGSVESYPK